jgi:ferric-dicitrate binding protein FerR (iron transport regulator)
MMTLALLLLAVSPLRAAEPAGKILAAAGKVHVEIGKTKTPAKAGTVVPDGASVETGKKSTAVIELPDRKVLKLNAMSRVTLSLPKAAGKVTEAVLAFGGLFAKLGKQRQGEVFRVRAENAMAAVKGTEFFTAYGRKAKGGRDLWVCVNEGAVELSTGASPEKLSVPAGQGVLIKAGRDLTKPQAYEWTKKLNWNSDPAKGSIQDETNLDKAYADLLDQDYR